MLSAMSVRVLSKVCRKRLEPLIVVQLADDVFFCRGSGFFHRRCETVGDRGEPPAYLLRLGLGVGTGFVDGLAHGADDGFISRRDGRPPAGTEALKEFAYSGKKGPDAASFFQLAGVVDFHVGKTADAEKRLKVLQIDGHDTS